MGETQKRYPPKVGVIKVIVKYKPAHCVDCEFLALRSEPDVYPVCCGITDTDILETEGDLPGDCPLKESMKERIKDVLRFITEPRKTL